MKPETSEAHRRAGRAIREARRGLGMTLEQLEAACGHSASFIGQLERGVKKGSIDTFARIAAALSIPVHSLFAVEPVTVRAETAARLRALLDGHPENEQELLVSTLRHLSRRLRTLRRRGS